MNIPEIKQNINTWFRGLLGNDEVYTVLLVVLVGAAAFGLGRVSVDEALVDTAVPQASALEQTRASEEVPMAETKTETVDEESTVKETASTTKGQYVASKTGSKYHLPWCGGAKQIKEENKVWFMTKEEAEGAGYTPAANCKGI